MVSPRYQLSAFVFLLIIIFAGPLKAEEKVRFGSLKDSVQHFLPVMAAEEKGFWKENGLEVEWVTFGSGAPAMRALAAKALDLASTAAATHIQAVMGGVPIVIVAQLYLTEDFFFWARADNPIKAAKELTGGKIGVGRYGSNEHANGRLVMRALRMEKEVKFVATGGIRESMAMLRAGLIDAAILRFNTVAELKVKGEIKELVRVADYLPAEWINTVLSARNDFVKARPAAASRVIKALLQAYAFIRADPKWTMEKLRARQGYSDQAAQLVYRSMEFSPDGKVNKKGLENVRHFLIDYGIIKEEKAPRAEELYTPQFTG